VSGSARFGVGLVIGVLLAWGGARILDNGGSVPVGGSAPGTTAESARSSLVPWFEVGEVLVESTLLLPRGLSVENDVAVLEYELAGLSPALGEAEGIAGSGDVVVLPATWVLTTTEGASVEATTGPADRRVRFELPIGATVDEIQLIEWRVATPLGDRVELPVESGASATLRSGQVRIATVLDQSNSTIVKIDVRGLGGEWEPHGNPLPLDQGWRAAGPEGDYQLVWDGADAPDQLVLEDTAAAWRPVQGSILVYAAEAG